MASDRDDAELQHGKDGDCPICRGRLIIQSMGYTEGPRELECSDCGHEIVEGSA